MTIGCSSLSKGGGGDVDAQLKVNASAGKLWAKMALKNTSGHQVVVRDIDKRFFRVETTDGKAMEPKNPHAKSEGRVPITLKPAESVELSFNLNDDYNFWDRLTKYRIWYEGSGLKSNVVQTWF
jgi:hypothetical protein